MIAPILLILIGSAASLMLSFGTSDWWAQFPRGLEIICWSRRLQWPTGALAGLCIAGLIAWVVMKQRKRWWLLGAMPILAIAALQLRPDSMLLLENPANVPADKVTFLADDDWVVGVQFGNKSCAYPFHELNRAPVILQTDRDNRMLLIWSPWANRATAYSLARELKIRDLEYVGSPANATLLYDRRLGQFINGVTGLTPGGEKPVGVRAPIETIKTTWGRWKQLHPDTTAMAATKPPTLNEPRHYPMPKSPTSMPTPRIAMIATTQPIAVPLEKIGDLPVNLASPAGAMLLVRDKSTGQLRAFDRHIGEDLTPRFVANVDSKRPNVAWIDVDTNTGWSTAGVAIDGPPENHGKKLSAFPVDENLNFAVMKYWYPSLQLVDIKNEMLGRPLPPEAPKPPKRIPRRR